jgi:AAA ATPase-like protein
MVRRVSSAELVGRDDELARFRRGRPGRRLSGRRRRHPAVRALAEALRSLPMVLDANQLARVLDGARGELARLVPDLGEPAAGVAETPPDRFFELVLGVLHRLADARAVVLVVEDLHWADRSTPDLLAFLVRNLWRGVTLLLTYRSDELHRRHPLRPFLAELERGGRTERVDLRRLTHRKLTELLTGRFKNLVCAGPRRHASTRCARASIEKPRRRMNPAAPCHRARSPRRVSTFPNGIAARAR